MRYVRAPQQNGSFNQQTFSGQMFVTEVQAGEDFSKQERTEYKQSWI